MFKKVLVANRGEIAIRIIRACKELGLATVSIFTEQDANALHITKADQAILVTPGPIAGYLDYDQIIKVAKWSGADAIHPGYGFISENWRFAQACEEAGIAFIGPTSTAIRAMGNKIRARETMTVAGVPLVPGSPVIQTEDEAARWAEDIGYPVMIKAKAGGGGKGMRLAATLEELRHNLTIARAEAKKAFADEAVYLEKFITHPKHIELQVMADKYGNVIHLGERDCSIQRRHQKLIEIAPSLVLTPEKREAMGEIAKKAARQIDYHTVGTVEFLVDQDLNYYFLEMNTRIQVEHTITEIITGIDIVKEQIKLAAGERLCCAQEDVRFWGHAIQCRINAEDPRNNFFPSPGKITKYLSPGGVGIRLDGCIFGGYEIPPYFDPLLSKLCAWGNTWEEAVDRMSRALNEYIIRGVKTTIPLYKKLVKDAEFRSGRYTTEYMEKKIQELTYEDVKEPFDIYYVAAAALFFEMNYFYTEMK
ncbi:MAG: acetyl-CoA carboxylase biotin carboxylase subunit [Deltaproteobacteria bacterium]|nr:acetyl-CoA carboxylase biotin carboxylase subunit [Deltaproteobacteria bacterium]